MNSLRDALLQDISAALAADPRFAAAWLRGSLGRGTEDEYSDIDLTAVVADPASDLLSRPWDVAGRTTPERLALFTRFGEPSIIHENHYNAPEGGTFTAVIYADSVVQVDWVLIPQTSAQIPADARMLFSHIDLPDAPTQSTTPLDMRMKLASERAAFFWMMAAVTAKYHQRGDVVFFHSWLDELHKMVRHTRSLINGETPTFHSGSLISLSSTSEAREQALRKVCEAMLDLLPAIAAGGGSVPKEPMKIIDSVLSSHQFAE